MIWFIQRLFGITRNREGILNDGLKLSLQFGKNWMQPIQNRLKKRFPTLTQEELDFYDSTCRKTRDNGLNFIFDRLKEAADNDLQLDKGTFRSDFNKRMFVQSPWVTKSNLNRIFNQAMYYAWKDGYDDCFK
jgi:hypothetical protein